MVAATVLLLILSRQQRVWRNYIGSTLLLTILGPVLIMLLALTGLLLSSAGRDYVQGIINDPGVQQVLGASTISALVQASLWRRLLNPWTFILWAACWVGQWRCGLEGWKVGRLEGLS
ncbi:MAG: hypothetical protein HC875_28045 [Anaerolineales bacterium]|nr:hypothetical protein [Anaerolineales bacterium]